MRNISFVVMTSKANIALNKRPEGEYFIAIIPPQPVYDKALALKKYFKEVRLVKPDFLFYNTNEKIFYKEGKLEMRFNYTYADNLLNKVYEKNLKIPYTLVHEIEYDSLGNPFKEYAHTPKSSKGVAYAYIYNTNSQLTAIYRSFNKKGYYLFAEYIYENGKILQIKN